MRFMVALHQAQVAWAARDKSFQKLEIFSAPEDGAAGDCCEPEDYINPEGHDDSDSESSSSSQGGPQWCWPLLSRQERQQAIADKVVALKPLPIQLLAADDICRCVLQGSALPSYCSSMHVCLLWVAVRVCTTRAICSEYAGLQGIQHACCQQT